MIAATIVDVENAEVENDKMTEEEEKSQWTPDIVREYLLAIISANEVKYSERFEASQRAIDAAFLAQKTAMETALIAQKLSVDTALQAADRAVAKAEVAAEKRFESVNEFRATLADQQHTLMPRSEATALFRAIDDKITAAQMNYESRHETFRIAFEKSHETLVAEVVSLREVSSANAGRMVGASTLWAYMIGAGGLAIALVFHFVK